MFFSRHNEKSLDLLCEKIFFTIILWIKMHFLNINKIFIRGLLLREKRIRFFDSRFPIFDIVVHAFRHTAVYFFNNSHSK